MSTVSETMEQALTEAIACPLPKESVMEQELERHRAVVTRFYTVLRDQHGVPEGSARLFDIGPEMLSLKKEGKSQDDLLQWVDKYYKRQFLKMTREQKWNLIQMSLEAYEAEQAFDSQREEILKEDLGWPHRWWVYHSRAHHRPLKRSPQDWFKGLGCAAVQDDHDPDRFLPVTTHDKLTVVGLLCGVPARIEVTFDENTTVGSLLEEVSKAWHCDPIFTAIGFYDTIMTWKSELNLKEFGVLPGTLLHCTPFWDSMEAMKRSENLVQTGVVE